MELNPIIAVGVMLVLSGISFFFALAESALFSLGKWKIQQLADKFGGPGKTVGRLLAEPQDLLATIVLVNTFANAGLIAVALWGVLQQGWPAVLTLAGLFLVILLGCEVLPKTLAVQSAGDLRVILRPADAFAAAVNSPLARNRSTA